MDHTNTLDVQALRRGLATLPPELWLEIYEIVFTARSGVYRLNNPGYLDPARLMSSNATPRENWKLLHVDRASRALFAKSYYAQDAVFEDPLCFSACFPGTKIYEWLETLPPTHLAFIKKIVVVFDNGYSISDWKCEYRVLNIRRDVLTRIPPSKPLEFLLIDDKIRLRHGGKMYG